MLGATTALELSPMIANAEAALTSVEPPASHAGYSTANCYTHQIVAASPARECHIMFPAFVYKACFRAALQLLERRRLGGGNGPLQTTPACKANQTLFEPCNLQ